MGYTIEVIVTDYTTWQLLLTCEGKLKPIKKGKRTGYYVVEFEIIPKVQGRNLKYEARWPVGNREGASISESHICIASAFKPGTAQFKFAHLLSMVGDLEGISV